MGKVLGTEIEQILNALDRRLEEYFNRHKEYLCCKIGCSACCEKGDYPLSNLELEYLMKGFMRLDNDTKRKVQENFRNITPGGKCPFLIDKKCSVYPYRPIVCRVHGLAYLIKDGRVKVPYCVNEGKNYAGKYKDGEIFIDPIGENLDTPEILKNTDFGEIRNLVDWLKKDL